MPRSTLTILIFYTYLITEIYKPNIQLLLVFILFVCLCVKFPTDVSGSFPGLVQLDQGRAVMLTKIE